MNTYKLILVALFFSVAVSMSGQETSVNKESNSLGHRYRAFVEMNGKYDLGEFDFSTTHGYQFNPNLYAGLGYSYGAVIGGYFSYVHADIRYDFTFKEKIICRLKSLIQQRRRDSSASDWLSLQAH